MKVKVGICATKSLGIMQVRCRFVALKIFLRRPAALVTIVLSIKFREGFQKKPFHFSSTTKSNVSLFLHSMSRVAILVINDDGVRYQRHLDGGKGRKEDLLAWERIVRATAFKHDRFTYDLICLAMVCDDGLTIEVDEEDPHWEALVTAIPIRLPGAADWGEWFCEVAFPAFETKQRVVFAR